MLCYIEHAETVTLLSVCEAGGYVVTLISILIKKIIYPNFISFWRTIIDLLLSFSYIFYVNIYDQAIH